MSTFQSLEMDIVRWGEARKIVQNSTALAQAKKTLEEAQELYEAAVHGNRAEYIDAVGDIVVTLLMGCAISDINLTDCIEAAYSEIKDRKGYLGEDGIFYKESSIKALKVVD